MRVLPVALFLAAALVLAGSPGLDAADGGTAPPTSTPPATPPAKPFLGIQVDPSAAKAGGSFDDGILISNVVRESTADAMGLLPNDLLTAINQHPTRSMEDLQKVLSTTAVGDEIQVDFLRKGVKTTLHGVMRPHPAPPEPPAMALPRLSKEVKDLKEMKDRQPDLAETLERLSTSLEKLKRDLPKAAELFKQQYPDGEFTVKIEIDITSDKNAKHPTTIGTDDSVVPSSKSPPSTGSHKDTPPPPNAPPTSGLLRTPAPVPPVAPPAVPPKP